MPYNLDIPGQISEWQLKAIEAVATLVPPRSNIVEIGSLFGRSSWAWAKSVDPTVHVFCLDPWAKRNDDFWIKAVGVDYGIEQFRTFTADCGNLTALQGYSPRDFKDWSRPISLFYEDAVHHDPVFSQNIAFWGEKVGDGIACGDDYRNRCPDIIRGVDALARRRSLELITVDMFWCCIPDGQDRDKTDRVRSKLRLLSAEALAERRTNSYVVFMNFGESGIENDSLLMTGTIENRHPDDLLLGGDSDYVLQAVIDTGSGRSFHESRMTSHRLPHDLKSEFSIEIPGVSQFSPDAKVLVGLVSPSGQWFRDSPRGAMNTTIGTLVRDTLAARKT